GSVELTTKKNGTPYQFSDVGAEGNLRGVTFFGDSQVKAVGRSVAFVDDLDNDGAHGLLIGAPGSTLPSGGAPGMGFYVPDHIVGTAASPISLCTIGFPFEEGTCESGPDELGGLQFFGHWGGALAGQVVAAGYVTGKGVTDLFFASDNYSSDNQNLEKTKGAGGVDIVPIPLGFDPDAARARFVLAPDGVPQWSPVPGDAIPDNLPNAKRLVGAQNELAGAYVLTADLNGANPGGQTLIISARTNQLMNGGMIYVFPSGSLEKAKTLANAPIRLLSTNQKTTMAAAAGNVAGKPNDGEELIVAHWAANALNNGAYILTNVAQMSALPQPLEIEETAALRFEGDETTDTAIERNYHIATMDDFDGDGLPELAIADTAAADGKGRIYLFTSTEIQANLKTGANQ
ncbi:MAG: hypothetical protein HYV03_02335, partial [Deltaproteobacteria bacterium]|nr:hypothetical protein [Deltaproteobacteria bacterium]